jgi:hypothetical protein
MQFIPRTAATSIALALLACPVHAAPSKQDKARREFLLALPPTQQAIPILDVDQRCRKEAEQSFTDKSQAYAFCYKTQQKHYDYLKPIWTYIPSDIAQQCTGGNSQDKTITVDYWGIAMCVNVLLDKLMRDQEPLPNLHFKY